jgi:8-oxo-dGTP diphosphatase
MSVTTQEQVSAGGVAFRRAGDRVEIALISVGPGGRWQLPKGLVDRDELPELAAQREVREEAGLETERLGLIETIALPQVRPLLPLPRHRRRRQPA